MDLESII